MRDRLCIAAFALAAVAFLVVLFSPAPQAPVESAGTRSEEIVNRVQGEVNAFDEDGAEVEDLRRRGGALDALVDGARPDRDGTDRLVEEAISRAVEERWPAFHNQLKIIRLYERNDADGKEPPKGAADAGEAARREAPEKDAGKKPVVRALAPAGPGKAVPAKDAGRKPDAKPAVAPGPWKVVPGKAVEKKDPPANDAPKDGAEAGQAEKVEKVEEPEQKRFPPPVADGDGNGAAGDGAKAGGKQ